jgi:hypothetical protein
VEINGRSGTLSRRKLATAAGLAEPPRLDDTELKVVDFKGYS